MWKNRIQMKSAFDSGTCILSHQVLRPTSCPCVAAHEYLLFDSVACSDFYHLETSVGRRERGLELALLLPSFSRKTETYNPGLFVEIEKHTERKKTCFRRAPLSKIDGYQVCSLISRRVGE